MQKKVFVQGLILAAVLIVPLLLNYMGHPFYLDLATGCAFWQSPQ
jgi:hypothetical protein